MNSVFYQYICPENQLLIQVFTEFCFLRGGKIIDFEIEKGAENIGGTNVVGEWLFFRWVEPPTLPTPLGWKALF